MSEASMDRLWKAALKGNKQVAFHLELCAEAATGRAYHRGLGLSRRAATLLVAIEELQSQDVAVVHPDVMRRAMTEATPLIPHLRVLHAGKGSANARDDDSVAALEKRKTGPSRVAHADEDTYAAALHAWFRKPRAFRSILDILAGKGSGVELMERACVTTKQASVEVFKKPLRLDGAR